MSSMQGTTGQESGLVDEVSAKTHEAASATKEKAAELTERGRRTLGEQLDERTSELGSQASSLAQALRRAAGEMRSDGGSTATKLAEQVADRIEGLGSYLERTSGHEVMTDMEEFARRRPWAVAGIGLVAGFAASRFLRASSEGRHRERYSSSYSLDGRYGGTSYPGQMPSGETMYGAGRGHAGASHDDPYAETASEPLARERAFESGGSHGRHS